MARKKRNAGWGLLAAAAVFALGSLIRQADGEPTAALITLAVVFGVLGLGALLRSRTADAADHADAQGGPVALWDGKPRRTSGDHDSIYDDP